MILNPRCKLSIFGEKTWSDTNPALYKRECRRRFELDYSSDTIDSSSPRGIKRSAPVDSDDDDNYEFQAMLAERASRGASVHDFDRYTDSLHNYFLISEPDHEIT